MRAHKPRRRHITPIPPSLIFHTQIRPLCGPVCPSGSSISGYATKKDAVLKIKDLLKYIQNQIIYPSKNLQSKQSIFIKLVLSALYNHGGKVRETLPIQKKAPDARGVTVAGEFGFDTTGIMDPDRINGMIPKIKTSGAVTPTG